MIKHSRSLYHIDLTATGLTEFMIHEMGTYLKRSRSLLVIHLSGNTGLSDPNLEYLYKRTISRPREDVAHFCRV